MLSLASVVKKMGFKSCHKEVTFKQFFIEVLECEGV